MVTELVAKIALIDENEQILLLRRSQTDPRRPGEWDFPGGGVEFEAGEDIGRGLCREVEEEAGIHLNVSDVLPVFSRTDFYEENEKNVVRILYIARVASAEVTLSDEHDDMKWVDIDTALKEFPHPFYSVGLRHARDHGLL